MKKTKLGLSENVEAALCYSLPPFAVLSGLLFLIIERDSKLVRFHAMQSFVVFLLFSFSIFVVGVLPLSILGILIAKIISAIGFISWCVLVYNAFLGNDFKFPFVGKIVYDEIM